MISASSSSPSIFLIFVNKMLKNTSRISFFLVTCTLLLSYLRPIFCEDDDSKSLMEDLNQLRLPRRELADTHTGDSPNQKKLAISIKKTGGGSRPSRGGGSTPSGGSKSPPSGGSKSTPSGGSKSPPVGGGGSPPAGGGGSRPVIGAGAAAGSGLKSAGSRISLSFNGGCVLSIVILLGSFL